MIILVCLYGSFVYLGESLYSHCRFQLRSWSLDFPVTDGANGGYDFFCLPFMNTEEHGETSNRTTIVLFMAFYYLSCYSGLFRQGWSIGLQTAAQNIDPIGFTYDGNYIVKNDARRAIRNVASSDRFYLCDLGKSELKECTVPQDLRAIDYLVGNLVLLNEQTLDPFVELEATCSTKTTFVLCKRRPPKKKEKDDIMRKRQNKLQGIIRKYNSIYFYCLVCAGE
ncbi:hypothetical protein POM88_002078 [Heracleum sosnowskyi]|uniref:Uncharacterized protein n=1 Tax=Heracleum sosnowskyi TaxID=360622 RepID=A0AAD8JEU8_9APIA|nr:hypothetical protein POM88_002078 [Heracleum sosnowskyi]